MKKTDRSGAAPVNAAGGGVMVADAEQGTRTTSPAAKPKAVDKNFSGLSSRRFQPEYTAMTAATLPVYSKETVTTERLLLVPQEKIYSAGDRDAKVDDDAVDPKADSFESVLSAAEAEQAGQLQQKQLQLPAAGPDITAGQAAARGGGGGAPASQETQLVQEQLHWGTTSRENKAQDDLSPVRALLQKCAAAPSTSAPSAAGVVGPPLQTSTACSASTQELPVEPPPPRVTTGTSSSMILIKRRSSSSTTAAKRTPATSTAAEQADFSSSDKSFLGTPAAKRLAVLLDHRAALEQAGTTHVVDAAATSSSSLSTRDSSAPAGRDSSKNVIPQRVVLPAQTEKVETKMKSSAGSTSSETFSRLQASKPGTVHMDVSGSKSTKSKNL